MLLYFFTLQLLGYRIFRWLFNFTISWLSNFTKFWWYKVTYYTSVYLCNIVSGFQNPSNYSLKALVSGCETKAFRV